jgi:hypothetical protein
MGEIDLRLAARRVDLLEEDLSIRAVKCAPIPNPPLEGTELPLTELPGISLLQQIQDRRPLQNPIFIPSKQRLDL